MSIFSTLLPKKAQKGGIALPSFLRKVKAGTTVSDGRTNPANEDLTEIRYGTNAEEIMRTFARKSPDVAHAVETIARFIITDSYTLVAKDLETDTINTEATQLIQLFSARLNKLPTQYDGFSSQTSINAISETLISQLLTNGCCASELVVDKASLPSIIRPISTNSLKYKSGGDRVIPFIDDGGTIVDLDSPAVCIRSLSQDPESPYATSWFQAAVQPIIASTIFTNDLRKAFRKANIPRVTAEIAIDKFKESLAPATLHDADKYAAAIKATLEDIEGRLNGLNPEDVLVNFDLVKISHLSAGNNTSHEAIAVNSALINGQMSAGLHVLPSLLGRGESQSTATTEAILFLKMVENLQGRLNEMFSYMFTLAARLQGQDVTVTFAFKKPSLRPDIEEESFLAMKQSRIMEQLSYGLVSDEEASIALTGDLPSGNFTPLSGTMFHKGANQSGSVKNPYSNTSVSGQGVNNTVVQKDQNKGKTQPKSNQTTGK